MVYRWNPAVALVPEQDPRAHPTDAFRRPLGERPDREPPVP